MTTDPRPGSPWLAILLLVALTALSPLAAQQEAAQQEAAPADPASEASGASEPLKLGPPSPAEAAPAPPDFREADSGVADPMPPGAGPSEPAVSQAAPTIDPGETFVLANAAYEEGDAQRAVELYQAMITAGAKSGRLYYNLGNAYLRNGELGRAIAAYRRSLAQLPRNEDVRANLAFARRSAKDAIAPPAPPAALSTLLFWHFGLSRTELAAAVITLNFLFWSLLALRLFRRGSEVLRWLTFALLTLLLATGGSLAAHAFFPTRVAVVVPQEVAAHNGPDVDSVVRFKLHAGTELAVKDQRDGWLRVVLPEGQQGWIQAAWAEVVEY